MDEYDIEEGDEEDKMYDELESEPIENSEKENLEEN